MPFRLGFLTTHPIQYQVPVFRHLARHLELDFTALFCLLPDERQQGDGFGVPFHWDVPLLDGYDYEVLRNVARQPSVTTFRGCDTPEIGDVLRRKRLDALIVNGWCVKSCLQALRACQRLGIPCMVRGEANTLKPRVWWKRMLHRQLVSRYAACLYIGEANREFYRSHGVAESRLFPARYCVENDSFSQGADSIRLRENVRRAHGIPDEAVCFLFSGKFESKKHPVELVKAFADVSRKMDSVHLLMVGDGDLRDACAAIACEQRLPIHFAGFVNQREMPNMYVAADCLVLPSDHGETWGLVVNEAMACGRPAIVSDQVGCAIDLIQEAKTGWIFPAQGWQALIRRLIDAAHDRGRLQKMGDVARELIGAYSPRAAAAGIVQAVKAVVGKSESLPPAPQDSSVATR